MPRSYPQRTSANAMHSTPSLNWPTTASPRGECIKHQSGASLTFLNSIVFEAYSPLGSSGSPLMKEDVVLEIAKKNGVEPGTILLSYLVNRDIVGTYISRRETTSLTSRAIVLPKSVNPARIASNQNIIDLSPEDIETLNQLGSGDQQKRYCNPPWVSHDVVSSAPDVDCVFFSGRRLEVQGLEGLVHRQVGRCAKSKKKVVK